MTNRKTKWIPLGNYRFDETDYIVFMRGNLKTGIVDFKTRRVHDRFKWHGNILPHNLIDTKKQWDEMYSVMYLAK